MSQKLPDTRPEPSPGYINAKFRVREPFVSINIGSLGIGPSIECSVGPSQTPPVICTSHHPSHYTRRRISYNIFSAVTNPSRYLELHPILSIHCVILLHLHLHLHLLLHRLTDHFYHVLPLGFLDPRKVSCQGIYPKVVLQQIS